MPEIKYLTCIFCGRITHLSRVSLDAFNNFSANWKILQVRHAEPAPGRGRRVSGVGGFVVDPERSLTIQEMLESDEHRDLALATKRKLLLILQEYLRAGVITRDEIDTLLRVG